MYNFLMLFIFYEPVQETHIYGSSGSRFFLEAAPHSGSWFFSSGSGSRRPKACGSFRLRLWLRLLSPVFFISSAGLGSRLIFSGSGFLFFFFKRLRLFVFFSSGSGSSFFSSGSGSSGFFKRLRLPK